MDTVRQLGSLAERVCTRSLSPWTRPWRGSLECAPLAHLHETKLKSRNVQHSHNIFDRIQRVSSLCSVNFFSMFWLVPPNAMRQRIEGFEELHEYRGRKHKEYKEHICRTRGNMPVLVLPFFPFHWHSYPSLKGMDTVRQLGSLAERVCTRLLGLWTHPWRESLECAPLAHLYWNGAQVSQRPTFSIVSRGWVPLVWPFCFSCSDLSLPKLSPGIEYPLLGQCLSVSWFVSPDATVFGMSFSFLFGCGVPTSFWYKPTIDTYKKNVIKLVCWNMNPDEHPGPVCIAYF